MDKHPASAYKLATIHQHDLQNIADRHNRAVQRCSTPRLHVQVGAVLIRIGQWISGTPLGPGVNTTSPAIQ